MAVNTALLHQLSQTAATLVVVSKTRSPEEIMQVYAAGQRDFGENRVQELTGKYASLPTDIRWHLIGHLQRNKVKYIAPFIHLIHSVDSIELLQEIDRQAAKNRRVIDCLLQFHVATEETKFGMTEAEARDLLEHTSFPSMEHVRIRGIMGMASFTDDTDLVRSEFRRLAAIFLRLKNTYFADTPHFSEISMGMSGDWPIALEKGSTILRIGSAIFS